MVLQLIIFIFSQHPMSCSFSHCNVWHASIISFHRLSPVIAWAVVAGLLHLCNLNPFPSLIGLLPRSHRPAVADGILVKGGTL